MNSFKLNKQSKESEDDLKNFFKYLGLSVGCVIVFLVMSAFVASLSISAIIIGLLFVIALNSFKRNDIES